MTNDTEWFRLIKAQLAQARCVCSSSVELIDKVVRNSDADAFTVLTQRHGPEVYRWCFFYLRNRADAEDLFQEVFLTFWQRCGKLRDSSKLDGWLFRIVRNKALNRLRSRKSVATLNPDEPLASSSSDVNRDIVGKEHLEIVLRELGQLRDEYQEALLLTKVQGLSLQAAAEQMGRPVGTVSTYINRGLEELVQRLKRFHIEFSVTALSIAYSEASAAVPASLVRATIAYVTSSRVASLLQATLINRMLLTGLLLLGLGVGVATLYSMYCSNEPASLLPSSPVGVVKTLTEINRQFIIESAVPRMLEEFKRLVGKDGSVRFLELKELPGPAFQLEFEIIGMLAIKVRGQPLRSKLQWYYYQPNGGVRALSDYFDEGKWTRIDIEKPIKAHEPWTGKEIFSFSFGPYKKAVEILHEMEIDPPPFIHPKVADEIELDPKWKTIRRIAGIWHPGNPLERAVFYIDQEKKVFWLGTEGVTESARLILEDGEYQLYGYPEKFTLSEDGQTLKGRLWGEWKRGEYKFVE